MVFSSPLFIVLYLPLALGLYFLMPKRLRNGVIFFVSLIFYGWGEPVYVSLMLFSTVVDFACGYMADKLRGTGGAKAWLLASVIINLSLLGFFKYSGFLARSLNSMFGLSLYVPQVALPIGISFYTFQTMSYTIDVYRGEAPVQKNIISFGAYVALFPQLIAGPIVRYSDIACQMEGREENIDIFGKGCSRFVCGLCKKVMLANSFGAVWEFFMARPEESILGSWIGIICYALQIYYDFSGYSDMALGLGGMLGFSFPENFLHPYASRSITEFWRRWHVSLGTWFREYVYIPLGGNRKGIKRQIFNMLVVWLLTGIWHGAGWNFLLWGLYYFVLLTFEKLFLLKRLEKAPLLARAYTFFAVCLGWVLFACEDLNLVHGYLEGMFKGPLLSQSALYYLSSMGPLMAVGLIGSGGFVNSLWKKLTAGESKKAAFISAAALVLGFTASVACLVAGTYNPFLYFRF